MLRDLLATGALVFAAAMAALTGHVIYAAGLALCALGFGWAYVRELGK